MFTAGAVRARPRLSVTRGPPTFRPVPVAAAAVLRLPRLLMAEAVTAVEGMVVGEMEVAARKAGVRAAVAMARSH